MWIIIIIAAPLFIASLFMKETSKDQILLYRASRSSNPFFLPRMAWANVMQRLITGIIRPVHMILTEPLVACLSVYTGFAFAMLFSFFCSFPYVFAKVYQFDSKDVGLAFLSPLTGFLLAVLTFAILDRTVYSRAVASSKGTPAPELRLYAALLGSLLLPTGLFW